jgi:hypothetical protein
LIVLRGFFCCQTFGTYTTAASEKCFKKMSWTEPMATDGADLPIELTKVGAADRAADGGNPDSGHKIFREEIDN